MTRLSKAQRFALVELLKWSKQRTQDCWFSPRCYPMDRIAHNTWASLVNRKLIERGQAIVIAGAVLIRRPVRLTSDGRDIAEELL